MHPPSFCPPIPSAVTILGSREKRNLTGTPCVARSGNLVLFQLIWKGTTSACHAKGGLGDSRLYQVCSGASQVLCPPPQDHAVCKTQTGDTWCTFLDQLALALVAYHKAEGLPQLYPAVVLIDNAPSHIRDGTLKPVDHGVKSGPFCGGLPTTLACTSSSRSQSGVIA